MIKVLFEVTQEYYWPSMRPIYEAMARDERYELWLKLGPNHVRLFKLFLVSQRSRIEREYRLEGYRTTRDTEGFDVVFAGDVLARPQRYGDALLCDVDHGPGFKTLRYRNFQKAGDTRYVVFVEGRYRIDKFRKYGLDTRHTLVDVGLPKHDPLFDGTYTREEVLQRYGLDPHRKTVVYAPSYRPTSIFMLGEKFVDLVEHYNVIVKLHPYSWHGKYVSHAQHRLFESLARRHPSLTLAPKTEHNMLPFLAVADTLVSEGSSVINEFLALGRCGVIVDLEDEKLRHHDGQPLLEERTDQWLRESFVHIKDADELPEALETALQPDTARLEALQRDREYLYTYTDGKASRRVKDAVERLLKQRTAHTAEAA